MQNQLDVPALPDDKDVEVLRMKQPSRVEQSDHGVGRGGGRTAGAGQTGGANNNAGLHDASQADSAAVLAITRRLFGDSK
jgi:hypothetical protein